MLIDGLGYVGIAPDTDNAEARRWFDQGVRLIWAYDEVEAIRAFERAQALAPDCALCFWGEAWARSPTLNLQPRIDELGKASLAARRAQALSARLGPKQRALIDAMVLRTRGSRIFDGKGYAKAMATLARLYPDDDAVLVIAADSEMVISKRAPKPGSNGQRWLEAVLARNPDHSGAIHLYIHLTDFLDRQALAEPYAERLGRLAPAASHLVHMPSHTFFGVGRYRDAAEVNLAAMEADRAFVARARPAKSDYRVGLYAHDGHFAIQSALMRGDGATAREVAADYRSRYPESGDSGWRAIIRASTWYADGLHAPIADVLALPEPRDPLMRTMRFYARGEAHARAGDAAAVRREAAAMANFRNGPDGRALGGANVEALVTLAQHVLEGRAEMLDGDHASAAAAFRKAMKLQAGGHFGFDPPPFWYPVRRSLAAALLAGGDAEGAQHQLIASLERWPGDPLALLALARAEQALGHPDLAARHLAGAKAAWSGNVEGVPLTSI
ncbi:hypothetical protein C7I55_24480 [Sphingomonas deserti]|uniref:Tetratricopeptide repeat protein n=1 Tax=Allosphingosinicella deserti TaxID=2116704 RepID=A0A2P7QG09_9SPHN|nr:hypothetical protein C7I55_24480 [Sphingomonas deserti]